MINLIDVGCGHHFPKPWNRKLNLKNVGYFLGFDYFNLSSKKGDVNLVKKQVFLFKKLVFNEEGKFPFYIYKNIWNSSLFKPNIKVIKEYTKFLNKNSRTNYLNNRYKIEKKVEDIECIRLDTIIREIGKNFDFIKIDAQGAEFNVLDSMGKYLKKEIIGIDIKIFLKEIYKGIVLYPDIHKFLKKNEFKQIKKIHKNNKFISDFLYIRDDKTKRDKIKTIKRIYKI